MNSRPITEEEARVLSVLREKRAPVSPRELLERSTTDGLSALGVRAAFQTLVDRGAARFTSDFKIEAITT